MQHTRWRVCHAWEPRLLTVANVNKRTAPIAWGLRLLARSPCLKLKPVSKSTKAGYLMVGVEPYGGGLWHTWFDRDLSVAGRVLVRGSDGGLQHRLVRPSKQ
jgi:aspartyl aminopeptidase